SAEDVQLYYQMGLLGRRDLPLAPDGRVGLEMALLRMLAFRPQGVPQGAPPASGNRTPGASGSAKKFEPARTAAAAPVREPVASVAHAAPAAVSGSSNVTSLRNAAASAPARIAEPTPARAILQAVPSRPAPEPVEAVAVTQPVATPTVAI